MKNRTVFYTDERNDDFSAVRITPKKIDKSYKYKRNGFLCFVLYRVIAKPLAFLYVKLRFRQKTVGKDKLKPYKSSAYFLYGNHTQASADPLIPNIFLYGKKVYFIAHPNNVSMPVFGNVMPYLGALPLPDGLHAYRNFTGALSDAISKKACVTVYPEAHIWPYYTKIRDFPDTSFTYPCNYGTPVFCFTNTYQKQKFFKKPRIVSYIDGPFFPDEELPVKQRVKKLRDEVYAQLCSRSKLSDIEYIQYKKKEDS